MGEEFFRASFFCGVGLGLDSGGTGGAQAMNGDDDADGVRVQTRGPFVLRSVNFVLFCKQGRINSESYSRFITDDIDSSPMPANPGTPQPPGVRGELGFSIDYRLDTACQTLNEIPDPQ